MRCLVVIPTFLEAENVEEALRRARAALPEGHILVVDDNSSDGTAAVVEEVAAELGAIDLLRQPAKAGLGNAYRSGFAWGFERGFDVLCQMDADLSHDPAALRELLARIEDGADVAVGSRYVPGGSIPHWPPHRRALSRYGNRYAAFALGLPVHDVTSGYRAYRRALLDSIDIGSTRATGYGFQVELAYRAAIVGGRIDELPITFTDRTRGQSKMSARIIVEAMGLVTWWAIRDRVFRRRARWRS